MAPHKGKKLMDVLAVGESPAVDYLASEVDSAVVRASKNCAEPGIATMAVRAGQLADAGSALDGLGAACGSAR